MAGGSGLTTIELESRLSVPIEVAFDLARSVDAHLLSAAETGEEVVAGKTTGLLELGDEITWRARHLGVRQELTSRITAFDRPRWFRDSMVRGAFARFDHDHVFEPASGGTRMVDRFDFTSPLGPIGRLVDLVFLGGYMRRFLDRRNRHLGELADSGQWRDLLVDGSSDRRDGSRGKPASARVREPVDGLVADLGCLGLRRLGEVANEATRRDGVPARESSTADRA